MMVLLYNCFLILIVGVFVYKYVLKYYKTCETNQARHFILLASLIHFIGAAFFYITMKEPLGEIDAYKYYIGAKQATNWIDLFGINKSIISFLIYPFVQIGIQLSVLFFVFSCISLIGLISYFKLINFQEFKLLNKFMLVFFLMPSIHFWGGFVGKEALLFTIMALFLYELNLNYFSWRIMVLFGVIFLIRPHVFFVMFAAFILVFILDKEQSLKNKYKIIIINVTVVAVLLPLTFIYFLKFEELNSVSFNSFLQDFITYTLNKGQTAINIKETSFLTRIGYNLFMPLPFLYPIYSLQLWWVALEGVYLLSVIIFYFFYLIRGQLSFYSLSKSSRYSLICGVLLLLLFSGYVYNLGLASRMRLMFYPYLFYGMLTSLKFLNEKKTH